MRRLITSLLGLLTACGGEEAEPPCAGLGTLVAEPSAWRVVGDADDPFGPRTDRCPPQRHRIETSPDRRWHELGTRDCHAATLVQPLVGTLCAGQPSGSTSGTSPHPRGRRVVGGGPDRWAARDGASGGGVGRGRPGRHSGDRPADVADGDLIALRLTNHGTNTWNLYDLFVDGEPP
ncbi:MAG: hypothetical protein R3F60_28605 [bacterium]